MNSYVYNWDAVKQRPVRKSVEEARQLLAEAGYPGGQDSKGNPLIVSFDNAWNSAGATPILTWLRINWSNSASQWTHVRLITTDFATK